MPRGIPVNGVWERVGGGCRRLQGLTGNGDWEIGCLRRNPRELPVTSRAAAGADGKARRQNGEAPSTQRARAARGGGKGSPAASRRGLQLPACTARRGKCSPSCCGGLTTSPKRHCVRTERREASPLPCSARSPGAPLLLPSPCPPAKRGRSEGYRRGERPPRLPAPPPASPQGGCGGAGRAPDALAWGSARAGGGLCT